MFTPIKLQYLGDPARSGGRRDISQEIEVSVVWSSTSKIARQQRYMDQGVEISATLVLEDDTVVPAISNEDVRIKRELDSGDEYYRIIDYVRVPDDLGLGRTGTLLLKKWKER